MTLYRCDVCNVFEYEPERGNSLTQIRPGTEPADFPDEWACPICASDRTHLKPVPPSVSPQFTQSYTCPAFGAPVKDSLSYEHAKALPGTFTPGNARQTALKSTWQISIPWQSPANQSSNRCGQKNLSSHRTISSSRVHRLPHCP